MENNSESNNVKLNLETLAQGKFGSIRCDPKDEDGHMITESGLLHVESLLKRAEKTDKGQSKWEFVSHAFSACLALCLSSIGLIFSDIFDDGFNLPGWLMILLVSIAIACGIVSIVFFIIDREKGKEWKSNHKDFIVEALEILERLRIRKNEPQGSNQAGQDQSVHQGAPQANGQPAKI